MPHLTGYKFLSCLHEGTSSDIYRAVRLSDEHQVVIKLSTQKALTEKKAQRFRREFELGQQINSPHVVRYLELKQDLTYGMALVMEDDHAVELTTEIPLQGFSNREFIDIAIQIVQGLQAIHAANIIHNDLKPNNILIHPTTKLIKISDFNRSSTLRQERQPAISMMAGTLAYISPEQTGRVNRSVDYRTDFYALGVTFYQLLCGELPFTAKDALGLIHQHLAKQPLPPHHCKSTIALPLSQMVMKLLEKEAENRYQSCEGILHDLTYCLSALNESDTIPEFELGQQDFSNKLTLSQHLYGRESEIKALLKAFERVSEGKREVLMVAGEPGVGKSMLIQEIQRPITLKNGFFLHGKFDQLNKNVAYSAVTQAFNGLIQQWLAEDETSINLWKTQLLEALGAQAPLLIKVVPALALLIGEQAEATIADISQAKNVLNWIFQEFVKVCATASHPLVIFLDDLQWADQASLELMTFLLQQPNINHLMWIGAYRDTEVTNSHPALQTITTLQEAIIHVQTLTLTPLTPASLCQWISDSLHKPSADIQPLVELIFKKTAGNPFFVKLFLQSLYDQQLLTFSPKTHWQWEIAKIRQHPATENVITLMTYQIQQLPTTTQQALKIASCLGHRLALNTLQTAMKSSPEEAGEALQPALNSGILIQIDHEIYFAHDRVQEAAYRLITEREKAPTHLTIGQRLLASPNDKETLLLDIVAQFNRCRSLVNEPQECLQIARLNLKAGQKVKQATAYAATLDYLYASQNWIDTETLWQIDYTLAFTLYKELAEVEYLSGHFEISEALINDIQPYLQSNLDKVDIFHLLIIQKIVQGQNKEAIYAGHQTLQLLGSGLPLDDPSAFNKKVAADLKQKLRHKSLSSLLNAPLIVEPEKLAIFKILASIYSTCLQSGSELMLTTTLMSINLSLTYGNAPESCHSYAMYGLLLCVMFEEYALGYQFGLLSIQLAEKLQSPVQRCKSSDITFAFVYHWAKSIQQLPPIWTATYEACLACGELEYAGYCAIHKITTLFYQGSPLAKVQQEVLPLLQFAQNTKSRLPIDMLQAIQRLLANLMADTLDEWHFDVGAMDEAKFEEHCQQANSFYALCLYHIHKALAFYIYGHFQQALDNLTLGKKNIACVPAHYVRTISNWVDSLARLALYPTASNEDKPTYLQQVRENQQQMQNWQASCSENFTHKYLLVEAELTRITGDYTQAEAYYDQSIELADRHGFIQEQALAAELAAKYWLARGRCLAAQGYLNTAFSSYKQWGAKRKLTQLKANYADLLKALAPSDLSQLRINQETTLSDNALRLLDLSSILKASHTISSEIELAKLLRSMMKIIIENAGAQQGAMILVEPNETLFVQAEFASDGRITTLQKMPLENWANGAHTVIQYVKRLHQPVVLDNAITHEQFKFDAHISNVQVKSILCVPLLKHAELKAILYLENNLMSYAFTRERVQTVLILTAQMTISLENVCYFERLAEQSARTQEALKQVEEKERQRELALKSANMGIWDWNLRDDTVKAGERLLALYGINKENVELTLNNFIALIHSEDRAGVRQTISETLEKHVPFEVEFRVIKPSDNSIHILAGRADVVRDTEGQPERMVGVNWDITQQKRLEKERLQALQQAKEKEYQRAQEAIQHKEKLEEITDTMCHELRNPLNGLYGGATLLCEESAELKLLCEKESSQSSSIAITTINNFLAKNKEWLETVTICANQLKTTIDDVLDYSKLEANKIQLFETPFDLENILTTLVKISTPQIKQKNLDIKLELPNQPILLKGDRHQLKRILINLYSNAIKFTQAGNIKIKTKAKELSTTETELEIAIEDTGIGITEADQAHIFERFSAVSRRTGAEYGGSGLGLAISKQLVEKMGGAIWVESQVGKGSKFSFTIKCKNLNEEEKAKLQAELQQQEKLIVEAVSSEKAAINAKKIILVVEDNILNQKILINYLKKMDYLYEVANNGIEALQKFDEFKDKSKKFDAILMDIEMPQMGGIEATQQIRQREQKLSYVTPIIGLSGYVGEENIKKTLHAGMNSFLTKPYLAKELYAEIEKHSVPKQAAGIPEAILPAQTQPTNLIKRKTKCGDAAKEELKLANQETAELIVKNAVTRTLGLQGTYGCAVVPEDEQQRVVQLIISIFDDRSIQPDEYQNLQDIVSTAIHCQSPWYVCFGKIYSIKTYKNNLSEQLQAIHDKKTLFASTPQQA